MIAAIELLSLLWVAGASLKIYDKIICWVEQGIPHAMIESLPTRKSYETNGALISFGMHGTIETLGRITFNKSSNWNSCQPITRVHLFTTTGSKFDVGKKSHISGYQWSIHHVSLLLCECWWACSEHKNGNDDTWWQCAWFLVNA